MKEATLTYNLDTNRVCVNCEKHGRVDLDDQTQEALRGLKPESFAARQVFRCPKCHEEAMAREAQGQKMEKISAVRKQAGIPPRFLRVRSGGWETNDARMRKALEIADDYIVDFSAKAKDGTSMIFAGHPGTGKTHLACAILNGIIDQCLTGKYITGLKLKQIVQETYSPQAVVSRLEVLRSFIDPSLLVLDEVDLMHASEDAQLILWEVISGRYNEIRPTILISNLNKQQLTDTIGERIIDRMAENGGQFVAFTWESHRRGK